ncbi:MAG: hypothetical protein QM486_01695 [Flavobacteriaceae bacterium]
MKNLYIILVLAIGLMSFISSSDKKNNLNTGSLTTNLENINVVTWNCCTVGELGGATYTVCCNCSTGSACRKARRLMKKNQ